MPSIRISGLFFIVMLLAGIAGCGKTGPLYLPDEKPVSLEQTNLHPEKQEYFNSTFNS